MPGPAPLLPPLAAPAAASQPPIAETLNPALIRDLLAAQWHEPVAVEVLGRIDSTQSWLRSALADKHLSPTCVCIADAQNAGRGRHGRHWLSPPGHNLYLSVAHDFAAGTAVTALSLALAVGLASALTESVARPALAIKWPNDLYCAGRKLAGILVDASGAATGTQSCIIGLGINRYLPEGEPLNRPYTDLRALYGAAIPGRNALAATVIAACYRSLRLFERAGFAGFIEGYRALDALRDRPIRLHAPAGPVIEGIARGIDVQGRLLVDTGSGRMAFEAGEVSLNEHGCEPGP